MHLCLWNVWKEKGLKDWLVKLFWPARWVRRHDTHSNKPPENKSVKPLCKCYLSGLCWVTVQPGCLSSTGPMQAVAPRPAWSLRPSPWRAAEVPACSRVWSRLGPSLSLTPATRTLWSRWRSTSRPAHARPCVATATWSSGEGKHTVACEALHHSINALCAL